VTRIALLNLGLIAEAIFGIGLLWAGPPLELFVDPWSPEAKLLTGALTAEIPDHECAVLVRHYQENLRRVVVVRKSYDCFVEIGRHRTTLPPLAYDSPTFMILSLKREIDIWNRDGKRFDDNLVPEEDTRWAGMVHLGGEGIEWPEPAHPWEAAYEWTAWSDPGAE